MANKIKLKRGLSTNVSSLQLETGELAVTTDTGELYVGDKDKKVLKINPNTTYTLTKSGSTITLTGSDGSTQSVSDSNTTYSAATQSANGLMSSTDKTKLDGIATGANNYSLPTASSSTLGGVKVGTNLSISNGVLSATDTKYDAATTSAAGLMSANDKTKLNGIATGATANTASTTSPKAAGTAAVGSETNYARGDHVHPAQTTVSGNAGTATKFASAQSVALTGDVTGSASSQAGWSVTTTLANSGVTAGSYGPTANVTGSNGATIDVPQITVDAKGRVTSITNRTYTSKDSNTTYSNAGLGNGYGTCSTEAATVAKTVALSSYALSTQGRVSVRFDENVPAAATLNINSKGAKAIYYKGAAITEGIILGGDIVTFVYNGTQYEIVNIYREDEDIDQEYFGGSHISIDGNIISVSDLGDYKDLLTTNKDTMVNAINELVGVDQALIGDINTVQTNLDTNVSNLQAQINNFANTGAVANAVSNSLVQIDGSKVEIGTTSSKLQVKGDGETFKLQSGSNAILEADSNKVSTLALSVSGSLNTGYHQLKKFTRGSEQRTGLFWIGEE